MSIVAAQAAAASMPLRATALMRDSIAGVPLDTRLRYKRDAGGTPAVQPERIEHGNARGGGSQGGTAPIDRDGTARWAKGRRGAGRDQGHRHLPYRRLYAVGGRP